MQGQAESLAGVLRHQLGDGAGAMLEAAKLIRGASRVLITGMGASLFASTPLKYALCARGIEADLVEAGELLHYLHPAYRNALVVMVSRSGESIEIARLLEVLGPDRKIIGLTNEPGSLLDRKAHVALHIGSLRDEIVAIQTYTGTVATLHMLAAAVDEHTNEAREEIEARLPELSGLVARSLEGLGEWDEFLRDRAPVYLLARGPSMGSALEGALLFNEIAKQPSVPMGVASFRHGPVELVDETFRGLIFAPEGRTRDLNLALTRDLKQFGGRVWVIGAPVEDGTGLKWCGIPECAEGLAPLFEIVPVQAAAVRMAQLRGIVPGSFRYSSQVATSEASFSRR
jgi:glucosamine--fructose-6-phosphate aminotransferase (isomerizing)